MDSSIQRTTSCSSGLALAGAGISVTTRPRVTTAIRLIQFNPTLVSSCGSGMYAAGALTGSDEVLDAAFRRTGVLRVNSIADIFFMSDVLAKQPRPRGKRLAIVTNAGGPGVLATDALVALRAGYPVVTLASMEDTKLPLNYHWPNDVPENLRWPTLERAIEVCERFVRMRAAVGRGHS